MLSLFSSNKRHWYKYETSREFQEQAEKHVETETPDVSLLAPPLLNYHCWVLISTIIPNYLICSTLVSYKALNFHRVEQTIVNQLVNLYNAVC